MERIEIHMRVNVTKVFELDVPEGVDTKKYAKEVIKYDPTCMKQSIKKVYYDTDTEKPISVKHYIKKHQRCLLFPNRPLHKHCIKLALYISGNSQPLEAFSRLLFQSRKDGNVLADYVIELEEPFQKRFTVDELLNVIQV